MPAMSDAPPTSATPPEPLRAGRDALLRHAWVEAFEQLSKADREGQLNGADLESLALASFFGAHADGELAVKERAFKAHESEGNPVRAAYLAIDIARAYCGRRGCPARGPRAWALTPTPRRSQMPETS